jgi:hypothetical protein
MGRCAVCGNDYDKSFDILSRGKRSTFDCFECAIEALAPRCKSCGCRIIGHGVESSGAFFCCAHCAHAAGLSEARDRL